jgi:hypothetical protein
MGASLRGEDPTSQNSLTMWVVAKAKASVKPMEGPLELNVGVMSLSSTAGIALAWDSDEDNSHS